MTCACDCFECPTGCHIERKDIYVLGKKTSEGAKSYSALNCQGDCSECPIGYCCPE